MRYSRNRISSSSAAQLVAERWIVENASAAPFRIGFHAVPSMKQLHLHVISEVFDCWAPFWLHVLALCCQQSFCFANLSHVSRMVPTGNLTVRL